MEGGMAVVYRVSHPEWDFDLALKVPKRVGNVGTFIRELAVWSELEPHPNVNTILFAEERDGEVVIAAEYFPRGSLDAFIASAGLDRPGSEPIETILRISVETAQGLRHAHGFGLVHQDFKPGNVLLADDLTAKVADFGLAGVRSLPPISVQLSAVAVTHHGLTVAYASPEQLRGERLTPASDVWSWGITVLDMLLGGPACRLGGQQAPRVLMEKQRAIETRFGPKAAALTKILHHCFAIEPMRRPSLSAVINDLRQLSPSLAPEVDLTNWGAPHLVNRILALSLAGNVAGAYRIAASAVPSHPWSLEIAYLRSVLGWRLGQFGCNRAVGLIERFVRENHPRAKALVELAEMSVCVLQDGHDVELGRAEDFPLSCCSEPGVFALVSSHQTQSDVIAVRLIEPRDCALIKEHSVLGPPLPHAYRLITAGRGATGVLLTAEVPIDWIQHRHSARCYNCRTALTYWRITSSGSVFVHERFTQAITYCQISPDGEWVVVTTYWGIFLLKEGKIVQKYEAERIRAFSVDWETYRLLAFSHDHTFEVDLVAKKISVAKHEDPERLRESWIFRLGASKFRLAIEEVDTDVRATRLIRQDGTGEESGYFHGGFPRFVLTLGEQFVVFVNEESVIIFNVHGGFACGEYDLPWPNRLRDVAVIDGSTLALLYWDQSTIRSRLLKIAGIAPKTLELLKPMKPRPVAIVRGAQDSRFEARQMADMYIAEDKPQLAVEVLNRFIKRHSDFVTADDFRSVERITQRCAALSVLGMDECGRIDLDANVAVDISRDGSLIAGTALLSSEICGHDGRKSGRKNGRLLLFFDAADGLFAVGGNGERGEAIFAVNVDRGSLGPKVLFPGMVTAVYTHPLFPVTMVISGPSEGYWDNSGRWAERRGRGREARLIMPESCDLLWCSEELPISFAFASGGLDYVVWGNQDSVFRQGLSDKTTAVASLNIQEFPHTGSLLDAFNDQLWLWNRTGGETQLVGIDVRAMRVTKCFKVPLEIGDFCFAGLETEFVIGYSRNGLHAIDLIRAEVVASAPLLTNHASGIKVALNGLDGVVGFLDGQVLKFSLRWKRDDYAIKSKRRKEELLRAGAKFIAESSGKDAEQLYNIGAAVCREGGWNVQ